MSVAAVVLCVSISKPLAIYGTAVGGDLAVTAWAERHGARELNPLVRDRTARYVLGAASVAAMTAVDVRLQRGGRHGWAKVCRVLAVLIRGTAAVHSLRAVKR